MVMEMVREVALWGMRLFAAAAFLLLILFPSRGLGEESKSTASPQPLVTNVFYDTDLLQALSDISAQTGVAIIPGPSVMGLVTAELKGVPLDRALRMLLSSGGYVHRDLGGYILVGSPDPAGPSFLNLSETKELRLNYLKATEAVTMLSDSLKPYVRPSEKTNKVVITAPPTIIERIEADLELIDRRPLQVALTAQVVELSIEELKEIGVDWNWEWGKPNVGPNVRDGSVLFDSLGSLLGINYSTTAEFTRNLGLQLTMLSENKSASIIANPQVTVLDGEQASVKVVTEEYFQITTRSGTFNDIDLEVIESGISLEVLPTISDNGEITLTVTPEVSNVVARRADDLPVVTRRSATTKVRVENGGTAVIAGLVSNIRDTENRRVPGLGSLPLIGYLFRRDATKDSKRQVTVFITPRIVEEGSGASSMKEPFQPAAEPVGRAFKKELRKLLKGK